MRGSVAKDIRRQINKAPIVNAALNNEGLTRQRVANLEAWVTEAHPKIIEPERFEATERAAMGFLGWRGRSFLGRLKWLLLGR